MEICIISRSPSFCKHVTTVFGDTPYRLQESLDCYLSAASEQTGIFLIHLSGLAGEPQAVITALRQTYPMAYIGIASDQPTIDELLKLGRYSINSYFNSYMAGVHYTHMLSTIQAGMNWFAPQLLPQMMALAQRGTEAQNAPPPAALDTLTSREEQIAVAISRGHSNKAIASQFGITERTVKAHLGNIFEKIGVSNRLELAARLHKG
jgi:two-component system nitrate/nitrite response regulator NarL